MFKGYDSLPPIFFQLLGAGLLIFFVGFWVFTNRIAPELLASSGGLFGVGLATKGSQGWQRSSKDELPQKPVSETSEGEK